MEGPVATLERVVAAIAARQHGLVTRVQLLAAGVPARWIDRQVLRGALIRIHRGVYRVGHCAPSVEADYLAAVLACGDRAALTGRAAAHLLDLAKGGPPPPEVVTVVKKRIAGVELRRTRALRPADVMVYRRVPVTRPARTLIVLAGEVTKGELAYAMHRASVLHGTTVEEVESLLDARRTTPGAATLRAVLRGDAHVTASKLERVFLRLLRRKRLPLPKTNHLAGGRLVDCRWPDRKLTVELDGYRFHASRHAWELDRKRERAAYARGDQFRRYTWDDVTGTPQVVLRELRPLLVA